MSESISDEDLWQLECNIEAQRLERNWTALKVSLEQYSHVFDRSVDRNTKYHTSLKEMKSFYWCCTAEVSFHSTLDFNASIDAIRRAVAFNMNNIQVRILIAHFLLCICQDSIGILYSRDRRIGGGSITASNKLSNFGSDQDLTLATILGEYYQEFTQELQFSLEEVMQALYTNERHAILSILASFSPEDAVNICRSFQLKDAMTNKQSENIIFRKLQFILLIAKYFLASISLENVSTAYHQQTLSPYLYWMCIDAIYTRSIIHEMLQQFSDSRTDLLHIIGHISPKEVGSIPGSCGCQVLLSACKLALLEAKFPSKWQQESVQSAQQIIDVNAVYRAYLPMSLVLSVAIMAAVSRLENAMSMFREIKGYENDEEFAGSIYDFLAVPGGESKDELSTLPPAIQYEVYAAYNILQSLYLELQSNHNLMAEIMATNRPYLQSFYPLSSSMTYYLPEDIYNVYASSVDRSLNDYFSKASSFGCITSNPLLLTYQVSKGVLGVLLGGITKFVYQHFHVLLRVEDVDTTTSSNTRRSVGGLALTTNIFSSNNDTDGPDEHASSSAESSHRMEDEIYSLVYFGYHLEIQPSIYSLYNFALVNMSVGKITEALSLLKQCQHNLLLFKKLEERKVSNGSEILSAQYIPLSLHAFDRTLMSILPSLGMKAQALLHPYLPAAIFTDAVLRLALQEHYLSECLSLLHESMTQFYTRTSDGLGIAQEVLQLLQTHHNGNHHSHQNHSGVDANVASNTALKELQYIRSQSEEEIILEEGLGRRYNIDIASLQDQIRKSSALASLKTLTGRSATSYISNGFILLLVQYAKCHWQYAHQDEILASKHNNDQSNASNESSQVLQTHISNAERHFHFSIALKGMMFLYQCLQDVYEGDALMQYSMMAGELLSDIILHYFVLMGESRLGLSVAITDLKLFLSSNNKQPVNPAQSFIANILQVIREHDRSAVQWKLHIQPKLLHLLTLFMTARDGDNPEVYALAIAFLQAYLRQEHQLHAIKTSHAEDSSVHLQHWNIRYSIMLYLFHSGEYHQVFHYAEELIKDIHDFMKYQFQCHGKTLLDSDDIANSPVSMMPSYGDIFPGYYHRINAYHCSVLSVPMACSILVNISKICGKLGKIELGKKACLESWKLLYHIDEDLVERLEHLGEDPKTGHVDHNSIDALKTIPTLLGWRIAEGVGIQDKHYYSTEADVYCECAAIVARSHPQPPLKKLEEIYQLAVATYPQHHMALTSLASIYFERFQQEQSQVLTEELLANQVHGHKYQEDPAQHSTAAAATKSSNSIDANLSMAFFYIQGAVKANDRNPESWQLLSMIARAMQLDEIAFEALLTSEECRQNLPLRPLASVLW